MRLHSSQITGSLTVSGSIIPDGSGSWDLGSENHPWKDLHILSSSIKMYSTDGEVGRLQLGTNNELEFFDVRALTLTQRKTFTPAQIRSNATRKDFRGAKMGKADSVVRVGITGTGEIDTSSGNLTLDSAGGTVNVDDNLTVTGKAESTGHFRVLTASDVYPTSGQGLELMVNAGTAYFLNYNRTADTYHPINMDGSKIGFRVDGTERAGVRNSTSLVPYQFYANN